MRNGALKAILATLIAVIGLALAGCGGDDAAARRDPTWRPSERLPQVAQHWWWEPVERTCEEDSDCRSGEECQQVRLGTCPGCPPGEEHRICVGPEPNEAQASRRRRR